MKLNPVIGQHTFSDGKRQPVYRDGAGRQYILDGNGFRRYGHWLPVDPPTVEDTTNVRNQDDTQA
jgi:hypothetical protein